MLRTTTAGFLLALLAACSSSDPDGAAATRGEAAGAAANADAVAAAVESNRDKTRLQAACDARFTAMLARRTRCPGYSATKLPEQENERPNFVTDCVARGSRPSSGLDAAFNVSCTAALADLGCDAGPALAVACGT